MRTAATERSARSAMPRSIFRLITKLITDVGSTTNAVHHRRYS
jgi:hypothetical protein